MTNTCFAVYRTVIGVADIGIAAIVGSRMSGGNRSGRNRSSTRHSRIVIIIVDFRSTIRISIIGHIGRRTINSGGGR